VHFTLDAKPVLTDDLRDLVRERAEISDATLEQRAGEEHTDGVARVHPRTRAREGETIEFVVDTNRLYFFDLETGLTLGDANSKRKGDGQG
jgi:hypothetical protein